LVPLPIEQLGDVELLIKAHHGLIVLKAADEQRIDALLEYTADRLRLPYFVWREGAGLERIAPGMHPIVGTESVTGCLRHIAASSLDAIYQLKRLEPHYAETGVKERVRELAARFMDSSAALIISDVEPDLPEELVPMATFVELAAPTPHEYFEYMRALVEDVRRRSAVTQTLTGEDVARLLPMVHGLTYIEIKKLMTHAMLAQGRLDRSIFERIIEAKRAIVERTGVLEYFPTEERLEDVAGLDILKRWLSQRSVAFTHPAQADAFGLTPPRGILLLGVQGCGKSLCAKAVARAWKLPLLRFDPSRIFNKYVGQTEKNLSQAMHVAERLAPVALWIDEIEKAFSQDEGEGGGVSARILGSFLNWMQERKESVFVIATANDVSKLPPELLRKGRFDEIFFVDLPDFDARRAIIGIHLSRRKRLPSSFDVDAIAQASEGFSGAEIEQAIVSALYDCFSRQQDLSTDALLSEMGRTRPLSVTMAERVAALRSWAKERAVAAD
jgi:ATP-dependent 26S proteasome regulatory subunit